ncbi:MAG TPA: radical SAM family heme chaperone HemW [Vicinamibacterales bacterium]|nr:radical SAM family heme chaperone HemW [Vicinamibacterales bacterium]HPW22145.1 radical SAM family heme chaperone HemW [Vicinamibacterales bacterium]
MPALGLYLHVPFCASICRYCDFSRGLFDSGLKARYLRAMVAEIEAAPGREALAPRPRADTVYLGGGTPSLLEPAEVACLLGACRDAFALLPDAEVTLEANPESAAPGRLEAFRGAGVNRLSLGVQSFQDDDLRRLGRRHDAARARLAFRDARAAGFANVGLDLMLGLPSQSLDGWMASVDEAAALAPEHVSLYVLELHAASPLQADIAAAGWPMPPDDDVAAMYEAAMARLERAGYRQYEISNLAKPGFESRHNLKYWRDCEWLGFGPGAHSTLGGARWRNPAGIAEWAARAEAGEPPGVARHLLTPDERWTEALITALRLADGVDLADFSRRYGVDLEARADSDLQALAREGLVAREGRRLRLTRKGMLVANGILRVLIAPAVR